MKLQELLDKVISYTGDNSLCSIHEHKENRESILSIVNTVTNKEPVLSIAIVKKCLLNRVILKPYYDKGYDDFIDEHSNLILRILKAPNSKNVDLSDEDIKLIKIIREYDPINDYRLNNEEHKDFIDKIISEGIKHLDI